MEATNNPPLEKLVDDLCEIVKGREGEQNPKEVDLALKGVLNVLFVLFHKIPRLKPNFTEAIPFIQFLIHKGLFQTSPGKH